ncbi:DUF1631 family protein [Polaromonas sp. SM01]|uniref:DUF1631 family protein n=1 Tax=Polaromonas sp. SM01 TaxID=3085630 RepID=UPI002980F6B1|nr:DUF1631 family protein [Polaromonas sp. SM01]MDW5443520.1 DUF1631 family protein [Polaromonas sp. SM01]
MTLPSAALAQAYQSCLQEAFSQSPLLIQRWCAGLLESLDQRAQEAFSDAETTLYVGAIAALRTNQPAIEQGFTLALKKTMAEDKRPPSEKTDEAAAHPFSALKFQDLELMGDQQIQTTVDSARLLQVVRMGCEAALADFSARLSTAQGLGDIGMDRNPLRPEVVCQALLTLLQDLPASLAARSCWLGQGAAFLGQELQALYVLLNARLAKLGVASATCGVIAPRQSLNESSAGLGNHTGDTPEPPGRDEVLTLDHLHHLLAGDYDASFERQPADAPAAAGAYLVPQARDLLVQLKDKVLAASSAASTLGPSLAHEVMGLMMAQMARDNRLLPPLRQVMAQAVPAYLRLAATDPRFFSDKTHPARRLLEVITGESLAFASENASGFASFMQDLQPVVLGLQEKEAGDTRHFAQLLQAFENRRSRPAPALSAAQDRAVLALLQAEQRNLLAEKIAGEIRMRRDFFSASRVITAFLTGPWAQVMAKERLLGEHGGLGTQKARFSLALGELLWSLNIAQASHHRPRLLKMIPDMLKAVREGLLSIDYPLAQSKAFFDEVMVIHQAALQPQSATAQTSLRARGLVPTSVDAAQPWLAPAEAQDSGFVEDWAAETLPPSQPEASQAELSADVEAAAGAQRVELQLGDWVELQSDTQWLRAQLTWVSPHNTLLMFTGQGGRMHSMTARVLQKLLRLELVKVISQQGVVDGALDTVARTAMRNSIAGGSPH